MADLKTKVHLNVFNVFTLMAHLNFYAHMKKAVGVSCPLCSQ